MVYKKNYENCEIAVIGGSGVYEIDGIKNLKAHKIKTPFGNPSDEIITGSIQGIRCAFLPRHGKGHRILPGEVNSRANIYALKSLGVRQLLSVSACGSLKEEVKPKDFLIPDQLYDKTKLRPSTFFGDGIVAHVGFANPFCNDMRESVHKTVLALGITCHFGGTYVCIEGPAFSTKAESEANRHLGFSIVGMTAIPEAKLAREAGICYSTIGLVTDYDVWKEGEEVSAESVLKVIKANVSNVKRLVNDIIPNLAKRNIGCSCSNSLDYAVMTKMDAKTKKAYNRIKLIFNK